MKAFYLLRIAAISAALCRAVLAMGGEPQAAAADATAVCKIDDFRVASANEVYLHCNPRLTEAVSGTVRLAELDDQGRERETSSGTFTWQPKDRHWLQVLLQEPLKPNVQYKLKDTAEKVAFDAYGFGTKATATVTVKPPQNTGCQQGESLVTVQSNVELAAGSLRGAQIALDDGTTRELDLRVLPAVVPNHQLIGRAEACFLLPLSVGMSQVKSFTVKQIKSVFGDEIKASGNLKAAKAPADKASSAYYVKFDGQAGQGQKPGYTIDAKLAPKLKYVGGGFYLTPNVETDLGFGSSDTSKVTDLIDAGLGVTRFVRSWSTEFVPAVKYETDRHGQHRNLLFDGEVQYFGKGWRQTIAEKNYERYAALVVKGGPDAPKSPDDLPPAKWGWQLELFAGFETGATFTNSTVKSSDRKTTVVLPTYSIARVRPHVVLTGQYLRASVTLDVLPRYIFADEEVTRENTKTTTGTTTTYQQIYLMRINGLRTMGTGTFMLNLDPAAHVAWTVTYKAGSEPTNFNHVNIVETGLVLKY
jgi:hypothetical protein